MKIKLIVAPLLVLVLVTMAPSAAVLDVTNYTNVQFLIGYDRVYKRFPDGSVCSAMYAELRSGRMQIGTNQLCKGLGITDRIIRDDLAEATAYVKSHGNTKNFAQYFKITGHRFFTKNPQQFCIASPPNAYEFLNVKARKQRGWKYVYLTDFGAPDPIGIWKAESDDVVMARIGGSVFRVNMNLAIQCGTIPYAPNLLLPSD